MSTSWSSNALRMSATAPSSSGARRSIPATRAPIAPVSRRISMLIYVPPFSDATATISVFHRRHRGREQRLVLLVRQGQLDRAEPPAIWSSHGDVVVETDDQPTVRPAGRDLAGSPVLGADVSPNGRTIPVDRDPMVGDRMVG